MTETQRNKTAGHAQDTLLRGERVYLRRPTMSDALKVFHWERDDEVWRYDLHRPFSESMTEFLPIFERNYVRGNGRNSGLSSKTKSISPSVPSPISI